MTPKARPNCSRVPESRTVQRAGLEHRVVAVVGTGSSATQIVPAITGALK